jgi:hypothetical protein
MLEEGLMPSPFHNDVRREGSTSAIEIVSVLVPALMLIWCLAATV